MKIEHKMLQCENRFGPQLKLIIQRRNSRLKNAMMTAEKISAASISAASKAWSPEKECGTTSLTATQKSKMRLTHSCRSAILDTHSMCMLSPSILLRFLAPPRAANLQKAGIPMSHTLNGPPVKPAAPTGAGMTGGIPVRSGDAVTRSIPRSSRSARLAYVEDLRQTTVTT